MSKFLPTSGFKLIDPKEFDLIKYTGNKIKIKRETLSEYQLINVPIGTVKKLAYNFFDKEKYVLHYENLQLYSRLALELKKYIAY